VTDADREFLMSVYESTREHELSLVAWPEGHREAFVRMQFDAQNVYYREVYPHATFDVIEVEGRPAGRLYVDRRQGDIRIVDISLLPEFRGSGIGRRLIGQVLEEAAESGFRASIHVEGHNRAARLYARMGFVVVHEGPVYNRMEWTAP
jgi:GNAT superfamily N-acetyltransferase